MRILHLLASTGWGGAERIGCAIHRLARAHGHHSVLEGPGLPALVGGVETETEDRLPAGPRESTPRTWTFAARRRAAELAPDIVHAHLATPGFALAVAAIAGSTPLVMTFQLLPPDGKWPRDFLAPAGSHRTLRWLHRVQKRRAFVTVSRADVPRVAPLLPRDRIVAIENIPPAPPARAAEAQPVNWHPGAVRLLSVGRLQHRKGFDLVLDLLSDPRVRALPWHWAILGDGEDRALLEARVREVGLADKITFEGSRPADLAMASADLLISASRDEGMPLVPMEAIAARVPVVLSRIPAHRELVEPVPDALLPEERAEWPAYLVRLLSDRGERERRRDAQDVLLPRLSHERFWQAYASLYEELRAGT